MNNIISGLVELVAYIITFFTLDKLGRKKLTCGPLLGIEIFFDRIFLRCFYAIQFACSV